MKTVRIVALHLAYGGVEKAVISIANLLAERCLVEICSVYRMPDSPAFPLDERVRVRWLLDEIPNREEWREALRTHAPLRFAKESLRALRILRGKKRAVREAIRSFEGDVLITTRHEDNLLLSKYGRTGVLKLAQLHHDHRFDPKLLRGVTHAYGNVDVLALLTPGLVEEIRAMMPADSRTKLVYIPNFLEHFPAPPALCEKEKVLLSVGRLDAVKGFDRLIRCFAALRESCPDWRLRIVGEGEERKRLEQLIDELSLRDAVTLTGKLDAAGVEREMLRASLFAMSSHSEGFPFVLIEAQSCALPIVAFDVRVGPAAIVHEGKDGFLVADGDEEGFVRKLLLLTEDRELRERMALAAEESARRFSREKVSETWFEILGEKK